MTSTGTKLLVGPALRAAAHLNSSKIPSELAKSSAAYLSSAPSGGVVSLPDLPYDYAALERTRYCVIASVVVDKLTFLYDILIA